MEAVMSGTLPADEIAAFLRALAERGETAEEIAAAVAVVRAQATPLPLVQGQDLCDTCGTGGDGLGTINVSTLAALVAAAAGVRVVKHGNRAASSRCGSADLLEALGVNLAASPEQVRACVEEVGFGFCFAPVFHPALKALAPIRKALGIRTLFNLVGPLANPAPIRFHVLGVSDARLGEPMSDALRRVGLQHGLVVHGRDGLDEVTTTAATDVWELREGRISRWVLEPQDYRVPHASVSELHGGDAARNAAIATEVLKGARSAYRDLVLLNAACAVYVAGRAVDIADGLAQAEAALASGRPRAILEHVKELTQRSGSVTK